MYSINGFNLANGKCRYVIAGELLPSEINTLKGQGIDIISPIPDKSIAPALCTHADMLYHGLSCGFVVADSQKGNIDLLSNLGIKTLRTVTLKGTYPFDVALNICACGKNVIANLKTADIKIIDFYTKKGYNIINVNQGYSKCSVAVVNDNAVITSDRGIYDTVCRSKCLDILLIQSGYIGIKGYDYGFIGGCCGKIADDILLFNGNITKHPDYNNISAFLLEHGVFAECLSGKDLYDNGGFIPLIKSERNKNI